MATSSLELGIDMGAVDLVIQVESPGSVARGLQRIGRAGHQVGEPSRGKIFPKFRGDLLEAAVVVQRMLQGAIEETRYPRNPLDVLAQQIVAMCAMDEWTVDGSRPRAAAGRELRGALGRRCSATCSTCSPAATRPTSSPSSGRGSSGTARTDTRPRRARAPGGSRSPTAARSPTAGCSACSCPTARRVGELDEEMVYESRRGEVFLLGASSWRIEDITRDRVVVSPAPGEPGKMPFWHGDKPGRPLELGRAIGVVTRELASSEHDVAVGRLRDRVRPRRARGREPRRRTSTTSARPPAPSPTTARSWSSASATRSATGGSACCRRSARACTRRGRWRSRPGSPNATGSTSRCCGATTAS